MGDVIVVTSGKGGVGKTTTSANIGTGLAMFGKKVVLIDTDLGLRNLDVHMGLESRIVFTLIDVIKGSCRISQALIKDKRYPNLYLLAAAQNCDKSDITADDMKSLIDQLRAEFDFVILDCPAGIDVGFMNATAGADIALVITTPEVACTRDADRVIGILEGKGYKDIRLIINRIRPELIKKGKMKTPEQLVEDLKCRLFGVVPDDDEIVISTSNGEPIVTKRTIAGIAFRNIAERLTGVDVPLMDIYKKRHFWSKD